MDNGKVVHSNDMNKDKKQEAIEYQESLGYKFMGYMTDEEGNEIGMFFNIYTKHNDNDDDEQFFESVGTI